MMISGERPLDGTCRGGEDNCFDGSVMILL